MKFRTGDVWLAYNDSFENLEFEFGITARIKDRNILTEATCKEMELQKRDDIIAIKLNTKLLTSGECHVFDKNGKELVPDYRADLGFYLVKKIVKEHISV